MKGLTGPLAPEERGALFEGMVAQLLRAYRDYRQSFGEMYYWAPSGRSATKVDFLLWRDNDAIAVEVKSGSRFRNDWCKGVRAMSNLKGIRRRIIVYPSGTRLRTSDDIDVMPYAQLAEELALDRLWM